MHTLGTINLYSNLSCYYLVDVIYEASPCDIGISCIVSNQSEEVTEPSESFRSSLLIKEVRIFQKYLFSFQDLSNPNYYHRQYSYHIFSTQQQHCLLWQETLGERRGCKGQYSNFNGITTNSFLPIYRFHGCSQ